MNINIAVRRVGGILLLMLVITAVILVFPRHIHDKCWNAAPFIFSLSFLTTLALYLITTPIKVNK